MSGDASELALSVSSNAAFGLTGATVFDAEFYNVVTPNDCFASITIGAMNSGQYLAGVRMTNGAAGLYAGPGYVLNVVTAGGAGYWGWIVWSDGRNIASSWDGAFSGTIATGDTWSIAAVGTTIYVLQNGTVLHSFTDTGYSSGITAAGLDWQAVPSDTSITLFTMGSASVGDTYDPTIPFLGSIVEVASVPAGRVNPFLGKYKVLSAAPNGASVGQAGNPYLGEIVVVANPPSGYDGTNPVLGQVVVIGSAPAGELNPFLGSAETE